MVISISNMIYKKIAHLFVKWENHRVQSDYDDSLIMSIFVFQFINSYITLLYLAFYPAYLDPWDSSVLMGDRITKLEAAIFSIIVSKTVINLITVHTNPLYNPSSDSNGSDVDLYNQELLLQEKVHEKKKRHCQDEHLREEKHGRSPLFEVRVEGIWAEIHERCPG